MECGHKRLRIGRYSQENQIYHLTMTTWKRTPIFLEWEAASIAARVIEEPSIQKLSEIQAWVVMPDHVHILIKLGGIDTLGKYVNRFKSVTSRRIHSSGTYTDAIWGRAFHDNAIRKEQDLVHVARYVVANPLRAGLVRRVGDYPYWNAIWL